MWKPVVSGAKIESYSRLNVTQWQLLRCIWNFFVTSFCQKSVFYSFPRTCSLPFTIWTRALLMKVFTCLHLLRYLDYDITKNISHHHWNFYKISLQRSSLLELQTTLDATQLHNTTQYFFGLTLYGCFIVSVKRETSLILAKSQRKYFSSWLNSKLEKMNYMNIFQKLWIFLSEILLRHFLVCCYWFY